MKRVLHFDFQETFRTARNRGSLGLVANWPEKELRKTMRAGVVTVSPLMAERLANLASALHYAGPIFSEALPTEAMQAGLGELGRLAELERKRNGQA